MVRTVSLGLAVPLAVVAELSKVWLNDHLGRDVGFVVPYLAVIVAAIVGGLLPGLLATALIVAGEAVVFLPPDGPGVGDAADQIRLALFVLGGVLMSGLCELGLRAQVSTEEARTAERAARMAAERSAGRATALAELSAALNQGLSRDAIVRVALGASIRVVGADRGAFFVPEEDGGGLRTVAVEGYPDAAIQGFQTIPLDAPLPASEAARTLRPVLVGDRAQYIARYPDMLPRTPEAPTVAMAAQPLVGEGRLLGVLGWAFTREQTFDAGTAEFLDGIGSLTVQAIQGAIALEREQGARHQAEEANRRLDLVVRAGQALGATLDYESTLVAMARAAIPFLGDVCVVDLIEDGGVRRFVAAVDPASAPVTAGLEGWPVRPASNHPIAQAMRDARTIVRDVDADWIRDAAHDERHASVIAASGLRRFLIVPLFARERAIGALTFGTLDAERRYEEADVTVAEVLAQRAAKAMENARLHGQVRQLASHERSRAGELESVLAAIGEGIVVLGPDGRVASANAAAERFLGGPLTDLPSIRSRLGSGAAKLTRTGIAFGPEELQLAGRAGTWVEVSAYPAGDDATEAADAGDSDSRGSVLVIRDVTAFRQGQGLREAFLGLLSHELRTPVTSIYAAATVLGQPERGLSEEVRADILHDIVAESDRLYRLVEDLLILARFDEGLELVREPSLLQRVVPNVIAAEAPRWPRTELQVDVQRDLAAVMGDETSIQQVVRNLVSNAAKYGPPGQPVEVVVGAHDHDGVDVRVLDRGPGIPDDEAEAIFAPFYRSPSTARIAGGAGIGLFVCRRLVEAMSGRIWARPRDGGGSEFGFWLPRYVHADGDETDDDPRELTSSRERA